MTGMGSQRHTHRSPRPHRMLNEGALVPQQELCDLQATSHSMLLPWVAFPVPDETGTVCKGFPTLLAFIWLLSSVCFLVFQEVGATVEGFPTLPTLKRLLPSVNPLMFGDVRAVSECFPTLITLKGLLPSVNSLMANVICLVLKDSSTFTTFIGFLPLKRNKHRDTLKIIFKRGVEGIKELCLILRAQTRFSAALSGCHGPLVWSCATRCFLSFQSGLLHVCLRLWGLGSPFPACRFLHADPGRRHPGR